VFAPSAVERVDLSPLSSLPASWFSFPRDVIRMDDGASVGDVFSADHYFRGAGAFLETAKWMSNPIDALYYVHKGIVGIQKGAFINRVNENFAVQLNDVDEFLCFDDLFGLLLGTLLGVGAMNVDICYIGWFIGQFAPRESLSAAFDFAKATVEGLAAHCAAFDIEAFKAEPTAATHAQGGEEDDSGSEAADGKED
jgi:hypothetical protein